MKTFRKHTVDIVQDCLRNDRRAQRELYEAYAPKMLGLCSRYAASREEAEDIMMESFMIVFEKLDTFRQECSLGTWMYRIAVNVAIDHYRKNKRIQINDSVDVNACENMAELPGTNDIFTKLEAAQVLEILEEMPVDLRVIFNLRAIEGFALKEIAEQLEKNVNTVRVYYLRARRWLQERILNEE